MRQLIEVPVVEVPKQPMGFFEMPEHAGKTFLEAFGPQLTQYGPQALERAGAKDFYFDEEGLLRGSNSLIPALMNQKGLFPAGEHLLSIAEFGRAHNEDQEKFRGIYQDTGLIVRASDSKESQNLYNQIKERGITPTREEPVVISLTDLTLSQDQNSKYGFIPKIKDDADLIISPEYGTSEDVETFNLYDARGIPIPDKSGTKQIWKTTSGVARVYSGSDLVAGSNVSRLAYSGSGGRVAVGSAVPQNYIEVQNAVIRGRENIAKIKQDLESQVANL